MNENTKRKRLLAALVATLIGGIALGVVLSEDDEAERPIAGAALEKATAAALAFTGEGRVTGTEVDDEDSYYEVEVTLDDGSQLDVQLDRGFQVVGSELDEVEDSDTIGD